MGANLLRTIQNWNFPRLLLVTSAFFTIAATTCFVTVWLELRALDIPQLESATRQSLTDAKERILRSLSGNASSTIQLRPDQTDQTDQKDPNAEAKVRLLKSLSTPK